MLTRKILVAFYLLIICAPVAAKLLHVREHRLEGSFAPAPRPPLTLASVRNEEFQIKTTAWFEATLGLRSWAMWIDNSILYHLFHETKWGSHVAIGESRMLFERDDINYFNKSGDALPTPMAVDQLAGEIARLQVRLRRENRALVPIFLPSKTTFYPGNVPSMWTRSLGEPRPAQVHVYQAMKTALDRHKVSYVDGIDLLVSSPMQRKVLWGRDARHFSPVAGCLCMDAVMRVYAELTGNPPVDYPCVARAVVAPRAHSELDLFRLLNAWLVGRERMVYEVQRTPPPKPAAPPNAMWISTSFGWLLEIDAVQSNLFGEIHVDYYNMSLFQDGKEGSVEVKPHTPDWKRIFLTRDLYVLELHESYLTPGAFFGGDAVRAILEDLGP
ncbi:MAG: hypothetical protein H0T42_17105 [Deltaproteobacteria bacterium]|nr:hypothetical protein [Deltaproteobacteria bacterium]